MRNSESREQGIRRLDYEFGEPNCCCPICGEIVEEDVFSYEGQIVGCDQCLEKKKFWDID